jgi:hypothetical protein
LSPLSPCRKRGKPTPGLSRFQRSTFSQWQFSFDRVHQRSEADCVVGAHACPVAFGSSPSIVCIATHAYVVLFQLCLSRVTSRLAFCMRPGVAQCGGAVPFLVRGYLSRACVVFRIVGPGHSHTTWRHGNGNGTHVQHMSCPSPSVLTCCMVV